MDRDSDEVAEWLSAFEATRHTSPGDEAPHELPCEAVDGLLRTETWGIAVELIVRTRSYKLGLHVGIALFQAVVERDHARLATGERERRLRRLYGLVLMMLDYLDRWEDFAELFDRLLRETRIATGGDYAEHSLARHLANGAGPFLLGDAPGGFRLHFLYGLHHRRKVIERKIARKRAGRKTEHLRHATQEKLSDTELRRRVRWLMEVLAYRAQHCTPNTCAPTRWR